MLAGDVAQTFKLVFCLMLSSLQPSKQALRIISKIIFTFIYMLRLYLSVILLCIFFLTCWWWPKKLRIWIWRLYDKGLWFKRYFTPRLQHIFRENVRVVRLRCTTIVSKINPPTPGAYHFFMAIPCTSSWPIPQHALRAIRYLWWPNMREILFD